MQYFIKEWPDHSASIYAEDGYHLETFQSLKEALRACRNDCLVDPLYVESPFFTTRRSYLQSVPERFESRFA